MLPQKIKNHLLLLSLYFLIIGIKSQTNNLTIIKQGSGNGYIYSAVSNAPGIKCGSNCNHSFANNSTVVLIVKGDPVTWSGDCYGNSEGSGIVTMGTSNKTCTATFTSTTMPDVSFSNSGWTTTSGATIENNILVMEGNINGIVRADLDIPITPDMQGVDVFLIGDIQMEAIDKGESTNWIYAPKLVVADLVDGNPQNSKAYHFIDGTLSSWEPAGVQYKVSNNNFIRVSIILQRVSGTFKVRNLHLTRTPLEDKPNYPFIVPNSISCDLTIDPNYTKIFNNNLLGFNHRSFASSTTSLSYNNQVIKELIADSGMSSLRFPGGTISNWYDWETDNFINPLPEDLEIQQGTINFYQSCIDNNIMAGYNSYAEIIDDNTITPYLVFNVLHNTPAESVERLEDRLQATSQHPAIDVKYIEMGNENYFYKQQSGNISANPDQPELAVQQYITHSKAHINAMRAVNNNILYGVNIHKANDIWTSALATTIETDDYFDIIVPHLYVNWPFNPAFLDFNTARKALISYNFAKDKLLGWKQQFPEKSMLISEWGSHGRAKARMMMNPLAAISSADIFFAIMSEEEHIEAALQHSFFSGFMGAYRELTPNNRIVKTPYAFQFELMKDVFKDNQVLGTSYESTEMTTDESYEMTTKSPFVRALAAKDSQGNTKIFIINKGPIEANLNINVDNTIYNGDYIMKSYVESDIYMPKIYNLDDDDVLQTQIGTGQITLPAFSINSIEIHPSTIAINDNSNQNMDFSIYPNPSTNILILKSNSNIKQIEIFNQLGQLVLSKSNQNKIDISKLTKGIYLLKITDENDNIGTKKVMRQ